MDDSLYNDLAPLVQTTSSNLARKFWNTARLEAADLGQEMWVWLAGHQRKVEFWLAEDGGEKALARALWNVGLRACQEEKAERLGYQPDDLYYWNKGELEASLEAMFSDEAWLEPPQHEEHTKGGDPAEGGNYIASLADVAQAYRRLDGSDRELLEWIYDDGKPQRDIAAYLDVSTATVSKRKKQALARLLEVLGGRSPGRVHDDDCECGAWGGPGSRKVIRGAQMRAITASYYEEG